jgi:formylglycine-generating enzyme required for sulfatase activity
MKRVFLSYSRKDLVFVERFAEDLQKAGYSVWYDLSGLEGGDRWAREIQAGIRTSDIFVVVISPDSVKSEWVEREFLFASNRMMKIVPVLYKMCELPLWLLNLHYIDLQGKNYTQNFPAILETFEDVQELNLALWKLRPKSILKALLKPYWIVLFVVAIIALAGIFRPLVFANEPTPTVESSPTKPEPTSTSTSIPVTDTPVPSPTATEVIPTEASPKPPDEKIVDEKGVTMVLIPADSFEMGSGSGNPDERPFHIVHLDSFYIDEYEVTNALYKVCVNTLECKLPTTTTRFYADVQYSEHPVVYVNWDMANAYCEWRGARLPTEAEWEKTAHGLEQMNYPWGNIFYNTRLNFCDMNCEYGWKDPFADDGYASTAPVGKFVDGISPFGAYDMAGNVMEWVADWYADDYYAISPNKNPLGPESGDFRVLRGGSWYHSKNNVRTTARYRLHPSTAFNYIGFRCARDVTP